MSDRREFLKQAGALTAVPWSRAALAHPASGPAEAVPKMKWIFSEGEIHIELDGKTILRSLCPGYQVRGTWKTATDLALTESHAPYSDRTGRGTAMEIRCKLDAIDGRLLLVDYEDGKLGCHLSVSNHGAAPCVLEPCSPLMARSGVGSIILAGHPAEWRVYVDSGGCGRKRGNAGFGRQKSRRSLCCP
jgi:hypothetical protein